MPAEVDRALVMFLSGVLLLALFIVRDTMIRSRGGKANGEEEEETRRDRPGGA